MIDVLLIHDNSILSSGLQMLLSTSPGIRVVGEAADDAAAEAAARLDPQVALVDADLCRAGGTAAVRALRESCPYLRIIVLGVNEDPETRARAVEAGANSFVSKQTPGKMLEEIRTLGRLR